MTELLETRSTISPTLPGMADAEPAEPEGTSYESNSPPRIASGSEDPLITSAMLEEEEEMNKQSAEDDEKLRKQHEETYASMDDRLREQRYQRLQFLLSKSNMYTSYLVQRMEQQAEEEKEKLKRKEKRKQNQQLKEAVSDNKEVRSSSRVVKQEKAEPAAKKRKASEDKPSQRKRRKQKGAEEDVDEKENSQDSANSQTEEEPEVKKEETPSSQEAAIKTEDCKTAEGIIDSVAGLQAQPELLSGGTLRQYQLDGYNWLKVLYENGVNGILADEMGLGKTIQCIAAVADMAARGVTGPFLVVAPLSTVPNWVNEFKRFAPALPVMLYHGTKDDRAKLRRKIHRSTEVKPGVAVQPAVVTSYEVAMNDRAHLQNFSWKYLIVDEGHRLKNSQCRLIKELKMYTSTHRLLLTGTPLQNNLAELWSLLNFLLPEIFDDLKSFEMWFDVSSLEGSDKNAAIVAQEQRNNILSMLHQILTPFMLRRVKADVELNLPPKCEVIVYAPLTKQQTTLYKAVYDNTIEDMLKEKPPGPEPEAGRGKRVTKKVNYASMCADDKELEKEEKKKASKREEDDIMKWCDSVIAKEPMSAGNGRRKSNWNSKAEVRLQLRNKMFLFRKICNHPYLIEYPLTKDGEYKMDENLIQCCGKMQVFDQMMTELRRLGHKVLVFSQMTTLMDILGDYLYIRGIKFSRLDGSMHFQDRVEQIDQFNHDADVGVFLLSTRAGGLGLNLVAADTVIIFDSDWNPQCDLQAQDRCHRIGQTKPVMIYRLVTSNTIDQKIVERAAAKRKLEKMVIIKGKFKKGIKNFDTKMQSLSPELLMELLESKDFDSSVHSKDDKDAISPKDLEQLLDRSHLLRQWKAKGNKKEKSDEPERDVEERDVKGVFKTVDSTI